jgi:hypothetical protein
MWKDEFYKNKVQPYEKYEEEASKRISIKYKVDIYKLFDKKNGNKYDFIDSNKIKYEVKFDGYSIKSKNFFIEFEGYGKPSGINATKADNYIITDGINYYLINSLKLKDICEECIIRTTKDKLTYGYIVPVQLVINESIII